jgi:1-acyl-sn-glycerol-3-phosphate acyltransferase
VERAAARARTENPLRNMLEALDAGHSLILFPEGTRGTGERLLPFKSGIYHLANVRPTVELVPVWMDNCYRVMPKGTIFPIPLLCSVTFGRPTRLLEGEDRHTFLTRLSKGLEELGCT